MAASVSELASFEGADVVSGRDDARVSVVDWNFTDANFTGALGMDHLNLENQRAINPPVST